MTRIPAALKATGLIFVLTACSGGDGIRVTADMIVDGDTVRMDGPNVRLTGEGDVPFDTPETYQPQCTREAQLGAQATELLRSLMPGELHIIKQGSGGFGRDVGVLYDRDGRDVRGPLMAAGLAKPSKNADWCGAN